MAVDVPVHVDVDVDVGFDVDVDVDTDVDVDADVDVDVNVKMFQPKLGAVHHLADVDVRTAVERDERRHVLLRRHLPGGKNHKYCLLSLLI